MDSMLNVVILLVFIALIDPGQTLSCHDSNGNEVDWYTVYKVPKLRPYKSTAGVNGDGSAHFYLDVHDPHWALSKTPINASKGNAISETLQQVYKAKDESILYITYNDERAHESLLGDEYPNYKGHTKGVVAFNSTNGFWLIHSVPKFPPPKQAGFNFPKTGLKYGQSFLCISFSYKELGYIGQQLQYNQPSIYDYYIPPQMSKDFPVLNKLNQSVDGPPWFKVIRLTSKAGQNFTSFAKSTNFNKDLYADLIAPTLKTPLLVETWRDGEGTYFPSNCSIPYKVFDVNHVAFSTGVNFKGTLDHSKWATTFTTSPLVSSSSGMVVQMEQSNLWTCIGDINRKSPQEHKGGGSVCINNEQVWQSYRDIVQAYDPCH